MVNKVISPGSPRNGTSWWCQLWDFAYTFPDKHPREWTKQALITLEEAEKVYMVVVITESHCSKLQLISCRFWTCLLRWQGQEVREEKKWGVEFRGHKKVKAAMEWHLAMLPQNHISGCVLCQNGTAKNLQTCWRSKETGAPIPNRSRQPTPEPMPPLPATPPALTGTNSSAQRSQIMNLVAGYAYSHIGLHCAEFFNLDASAQDSQHSTDFDPEMLTDEGTSTG